MKQMWKIITAIILVGILGIASGFYFSNIINENANNNTPTNNGEEENNSQPSEDPLLTVASNIVLKSYYAETNTNKDETDIILIVNAPGLYEVWVKYTARFLLYTEDKQGMAGAYYYGLEDIENMGNNEYKITIPGVIYLNLNGIKYYLNLGHGWTGETNFFIPYKNTYPISKIQFNTKLHVKNYLLLQWSYENNTYSIFVFEYLNITNDGNCPFYFRLYGEVYSNIKAIDLYIQGKTLSMQWAGGPKCIKRGMNVYKFIVDPQAKFYLSAGDWPAKVIFYSENSKYSISVNFTIHIGS